MQTYYLVKTGPNSFDMRQTRYADQFRAGKEHPHDLMAVSFTAEGIREIVSKWFKDCDMSALEGQA